MLTWEIYQLSVWTNVIGSSQFLNETKSSNISRLVIEKVQIPYLNYIEELMNE